MIEWYEHPDDEHTVHHVYYPHRMPGDNWYGFSPPEPPFYCEECGKGLENDDYVWDGRIVCKDCYDIFYDEEYGEEEKETPCCNTTPLK